MRTSSSPTNAAASDATAAKPKPKKRTSSPKLRAARSASTKFRPEEASATKRAKPKRRITKVKKPAAAADAAPSPKRTWRNKTPKGTEEKAENTKAEAAPSSQKKTTTTKKKTTLKTAAKVLAKSFGLKKKNKQDQQNAEPDPDVETPYTGDANDDYDYRIFFKKKKETKSEGSSEELSESGSKEKKSRSTGNNSEDKPSSQSKKKTNKTSADTNPYKAAAPPQSPYVQPTWFCVPHEAAPAMKGAPRTLEASPDLVDLEAPYDWKDLPEETDASIIEEAAENEGVEASHETDRSNPGGTVGEAEPSEDTACEPGDAIDRSDAIGLEDAEGAEFPDSSATTDDKTGAEEAIGVVAHTGAVEAKTETEETAEAIDEPPAAEDTADVSMEEAEGSDAAIPELKASTSDPALADARRVEGETEPEQDQGKDIQEGILEAVVDEEEPEDTEEPDEAESPTIPAPILVEEPSEAEAESDVSFETHAMSKIKSGQQPREEPSPAKALPGQGARRLATLPYHRRIVAPARPAAATSEDPAETGAVGSVAPQYLIENQPSPTKKKKKTTLKTAAKVFAKSFGLKKKNKQGQQNADADADVEIANHGDANDDYDYRIFFKKKKETKSEGSEIQVSAALASEEPSESGSKEQKSRSIGNHSEDKPRSQSKVKTSARSVDAVGTIQEEEAAAASLQAAISDVDEEDDEEIALDFGADPESKAEAPALLEHSQEATAQGYRYFHGSKGSFYSEQDDRPEKEDCPSSSQKTPHEAPPSLYSSSSSVSSNSNWSQDAHPLGEDTQTLPVDDLPSVAVPELGASRPESPVVLDEFLDDGGSHAQEHDHLGPLEPKTHHHQGEAPIVEESVVVSGNEKSKEQERWCLKVPEQFPEEEVLFFANQSSLSSVSYTVEDQAEAVAYLDGDHKCKEPGESEKEDITPDILTEMNHLSGLLSSPDLFQRKKALERMSEELQKSADDYLPHNLRSPEFEYAMAHAIVCGGYDTAEAIRRALVSYMNGEGAWKEPGRKRHSLKTRSGMLAEALHCVLAALEAAIGFGESAADADDTFWRPTVSCLVREIERGGHHHDALRILWLLETLDPETLGRLVRRRLRPHLLRLRSRARDGTLPLTESEVVLWMERSADAGRGQPFAE